MYVSFCESTCECVCVFERVCELGTVCMYVRV